jgi:hypothetical protein
MLSLTSQELAILAQQQYALMKTKGNFMKSQVIEYEIVAMRSKMVQLKGKLALSKNVDQAGTKKTGRGTNKQCQKRDAAWKKVPPKAGKPLTKSIRAKDFHWCEHHMAWTVHLPADCRLNVPAKANGSATPTNANPPPTGATAAAATFTAEGIMSLIGSTMGLAEDLDY